MPVWNDFPHINSEVDKLDYDEYIAYWESTNQGNPFDIEYMEPYEPEGSIRYYSIGETAELALQAANSTENSMPDLNSKFPNENINDSSNQDLLDSINKKKRYY